MTTPMRTGTTGTDATHAVLSALDAETATLAAAAADAIFTELDGYGDVPRQAIEGSMRSNVSRVVSTLRSGRPPTSLTRAEAETITLERAEQGVPIDDIIRAYRLSLRVLHERFLELADEAAIPPAVILDCSNLLWQVGDWFIAIAASTFRDYQIERTVRQSVRRAEVLRDLLGGMPSEPELRAAATTLGLDPAAHYSVFCIPRTAAADALALARSHPGGTAEIAGRVFGLVVDGGDPVIPGAAIAVGPARSLGALHESTQVASRIAELIEADAPGVYRVRDLPWAVAAAAEPEVLVALRRTYLDPLEGRGSFGELLLASVRVYLACDLNIAAAAQVLVIHPNTLRYRLAKYEDLVGVQLTTTRAIAELTMVLDLRLT